VYVGLVDLGVTENLLDGLESATEEVLAELFETGTRQGGVEIDTLEEGVNFDGGLSGGGEGTLSTLASSTETADGTLVAGEILLVLALELLHEVVDETVIKVLTTQMGVTGGGLDFEDTLLDGKERDIEGSSAEIENEDIALARDLLVKTVGDCSGGGLVDDTEDIHASNGTGVLGRLTLRVVEVGGDGDDGIVNGGTEVGFGGLLHLGEYHGGDFLRGELLLLTTVLDLDIGLAALAEDLEREVLDIRLDLNIVKLAADETLSIEDTRMIDQNLLKSEKGKKTYVLWGFMAT
jgi:hypothetical protein